MPTYNLAGLLELTPQKIDQRTLTKFITRHGSGIEAVFGPQKVSEFQTIPSDQAEAIVDGLKGMADYLLIDFPTLVEPGVQPALQSCDFVVVALEPDTLSATAAKATLATLNAWGISSGMIGVIVVNKRILSMQLNDIRSYLGCEILGVIPPAVEDALLALTRGIPLVQFRPTNTAVLQLTELAAILSGEKQPALTGSR
jgi:MinD-like ATPase involved in chromosome partitioning or flagellar assembly